MYFLTNAPTIYSVPHGIIFLLFFLSEFWRFHNTKNVKAICETRSTKITKTSFVTEPCRIFWTSYIKHPTFHCIDLYFFQCFSWNIFSYQRSVRRLDYLVLGRLVMRPKTYMYFWACQVIWVSCCLIGIAGQSCGLWGSSRVTRISHLAFLHSFRLWLLC